MGRVGGQSKCTSMLRTKPKTWKQINPKIKSQSLSCTLNTTDDVLYGLLAALHLKRIWKEQRMFSPPTKQAPIGLHDKNLHNFTCVSDKNWYVKESLRQRRIPEHSFDQKHYQTHCKCTEKSDQYIIYNLSFTEERLSSLQQHENLLFWMNY